MKKKITVVFILILILFNFIATNSSFSVNANNIIKFAEDSTNGTVPSTNADTTSTGGETTTTTTTSITDIIDTSTINATGIMNEITTGTPTITGGGSNSTETTTKTKNIKNIVSSSSTTTFGILTSVWIFIVGEWINNIPQVIVEATGSTVIDNKFTIYDLVMGNYEFFNMNFFDLAENNSENKTFGETITSAILTFYNIFKELALGISIFVLIYIGIRMAISTVTTDRAKYKKMFMNWVSSIILIFFMHYIIIIICYLNQQGLKLVKTLCDLFGVTNIESGILSGQITTLKNNSAGLHLITSLIMCTIFIYYEIKFLVAYIGRFCEIAFLIVVSPLVTITYSIDKVGDNSAQAFSAWLKELIVKYSIQVVHAFTYFALITCAGAIAQTMPIIGALFLAAMSRAEKVMRNVFDIQDKNFEKARVPIIEHKHPRRHR